MSKPKKVSISVYTVGQSFGCKSEIKSHGRVIWTSRLFPYGFRGEARQAAVEKARDEGWTVGKSRKRNPSATKRIVRKATNKKNPAGVHVKNFTGTITKLPNGTVLVKGRKK